MIFWFYLTFPKLSLVYCTFQCIYDAARQPPGSHIMFHCTHTAARAHLYLISWMDMDAAREQWAKAEIGSFVEAPLSPLSLHLSWLTTVYEQDLSDGGLKNNGLVSKQLNSWESGVRSKVRKKEMDSVQGFGCRDGRTSRWSMEYNLACRGRRPPWWREKKGFSEIFFLSEFSYDCSFYTRLRVPVQYEL